MTFRVKFSEQGGSFRARFGEVQNISDGGFERGYAKGYAEGREDGYAVGYKEGYNEMKLAVDMSDETYRFNEKVTSHPGNWYRMDLNFTDANGVAYNRITTFTSIGKINIQYTTVSGSHIEAYNAANSPMWADEAYRTIHITDGAMTGDVKTCAWLIENGTFNPKESL